MDCPRCGTPQGNHMRFCEQCGAALKGSGGTPHSARKVAETPESAEQAVVEEAVAVPETDIIQVTEPVAEAAVPEVEAVAEAEAEPAAASEPAPEPEPATIDDPMITRVVSPVAGAAAAGSDITQVMPDADATLLWPEDAEGQPFDPTLADMKIPYAGDGVDSGHEAAIASLEAEDQSRAASVYSRYDKPAPEEDAAAAASETGGTPAAPAPGPSEAEKLRKRKSLAIMLVIIIVLAGLIAGGIAYYLMTQKHSSGSGGAQETLIVRLDIPDYREGMASPVPIKVTGTTSEGGAVSQVFCVTPSDNTIALDHGSYTVSAAGSPITSSGTIYYYPDIPNKVVITDAGIRVDEVKTDAVSYAYTPIAPELVTDEQIDAAYDWMVQAGLSDDVAIPYRNAVIAARQSRLNQLQQEAAANQQAADQQAQQNQQNQDGTLDGTGDESQSGYYIENDLVSFDVPDSWAGQVEFDTQVTDNADLLRVYVYGNPQLPIMIVRAQTTEQADSSVTIEDDSVDADMVEIWRTDKDGIVYTIEACEWPSHFAQDPNYLGISDDQKEQLVSLSTGGAVTSDTVGSANEHSVQTFLERAVIPTLQIK